MTSYNVGDSVPYAAVASTYGFTAESHQYYWTFDDAATAGTQTADKVWSTIGIHGARVRAIQPDTGGVAYASIDVPILGVMPTSNSMFAARAFHSSLQLNNGKVLVMGGFSYGLSGAITNCDLYDPTTNTFSATGSLNTARGCFAATKLANGDVLVTGGCTHVYFYLNGNIGGVIDTAEIYSVANGTWSYTTGNMAITRCAHSSHLLPSGKVLVVAGATGYFTQTNATEIYDPATGIFSAGPSVINNMAWHPFANLSDGRVMVWGGGWGKKTEMYTEGSGWSTKADCLGSWMNNSVWGCGFGIYGDTVYQVSGEIGILTSSNSSSQFATYSIANNEWTDHGDIATQVGWGNVSAATSSGIFSAGCTSTMSKADFLRVGSTTHLADLTDGRNFSSAVYMTNGYILVTGGWSNPTTYNSASVYYLG